MRTVIAFDVSDDRARYRVVKALKAFAVRVQKSVFEAADLDRAAFLRMRSLVERHIEPSTDSVRYYRLCEGCVGKVEHYGAGPGVLDDPEPCDVV
ncbi:MAG: CRISPR-associated endonuclease Cas2 [Deltaproteobacteria bacterium HGW-Deltaproteobacteria-20]|jgi:CRISPR-associated protein Cas2|nr:MAG: CRISPR-associated endonuclease Cas2 [Deltaproteobacteria bacterium HGW-Deltaproteobacteria-20]